MKLAEALILRADQQRHVEQLKHRLICNAKVQEGDQPAEEPTMLIEEMEKTLKDLAKIVQRINKTNSNTKFKKNTLTDALAIRDNLKMKCDIYRELCKTATVTQDRYSKSEVKFISTVNVADIQKIADRLAKEHRELDAAIQELNWSTMLL
jgi:hypothetical protein